MKSKSNSTAMIGSLVGLLVIFSCTKSPVGEDEVSTPLTQIKGEVTVGQNLSRQDIFVWLDGFDVGARTDRNGQFVIDLPPKGLQSSIRGASGAFHLFYYIANFRLTTTEVFTKEGQFIVPSAEIDEQGELREPHFMPLLMEITTIIDPPVYRRTVDDLVNIQFALRSLSLTDTIRVYFPRNVDDTPGPVLLRNLQSGEVSIFQSAIVDTGSNDFANITAKPYVRETFVKFRGTQVEEGTYEVVPFLLMRHEPVPAGLISGLGDEVEELGPDYFQIPFRRQGGILQVR